MIIHNQWAYNTEILNLKQIDPKAWGRINCNHLYVTQSEQVASCYFYLFITQKVRIFIAT